MLSPLQLGVNALALVLLAGLDAPLSIIALGLLSFNHVVPLRPAVLPFVGGWSLGALAVIAAFQAFADLYFVPVSVRDAQYIAPARMTNAHVHARLQSLLRPLIGALVVAALPGTLPVQPVAVACFFAGTAVYWFSAWVREWVAITRGTLVLMLLEVTKQLLLLLVLVLVIWSPTLALLSLGLLCSLTALWTLRLQRESPVQTLNGGFGVADDA